MPTLTDPIDLSSGHRAPSRVLFGPHVTNLGERRALGARHVGYYRERAAGGTGVLVTETASVRPDDHPYERAPLAADCCRGWTELAAACRPFGTVLLAGLGHAGSQGSSAYSRTVLWGASRVADPLTRELPAELEAAEIDEVVTGFAESAALAVSSGLAGVEIDAGVRSLLRQFQSGLTNLRTDAYGLDPLLLTRRVLGAVRDAIGTGRVLALRLSCDELAPWAGITPDRAAETVDELADRVDLLVVVRGGPFATDAYRPDGHTAPMFNRDLAHRVRRVAAGRTLVVLQGSVVDVDGADRSLEDGTADLVEMTRRQIAEPRLVDLVRAGTPERARPCLLCNQACQVDDVANLTVSCVGEPRSGHETVDPPVEGRDTLAVPTVVVGGGPAGLEAARVLALRGHPVRLVEATAGLGGALRRAAVGPGRERLALLTGWLESEVRRLGVEIELGRSIDGDEVRAIVRDGAAVLLATGSRAAPPPGARDVLEVLTTGADGLAPGAVVVDDPAGGPVGVAVAEWLAGQGRSVTLVSPDPVVGSRLASAGDLPAANARLARAGIRRETGALVRELRDGQAVLEDVWSGARRGVPGAVLVDCGPRFPERVSEQVSSEVPRAGDCVAPRTVREAVFDGRHRALDIAARPGPRGDRPPWAEKRDRPEGAHFDRRRRQASPELEEEEIMGRLEGKVAFITGAARGQGRSHAIRLAQEGADIIAVDLCGQIGTVPYEMSTPEDLQQTVKEVESLDRRIVARQADVRDLAALQAAVDEGVAELGHLDIVSANAGIAGGNTPGWETPEDAWQNTIAVNLTGVWHTAKAAIPHLLAGGNGGSIILTSSAAGLKAFPNIIDYNTAKHGVVGIMRTLAVELAPHRVRVNSVHPTTVNTPMINNDWTYKLFRPDLEHPTVDDALVAYQSINALPIPWVEAVDISNAVLWLASDEARYVTGVTLPVDAGFMLK